MRLCFSVVWHPKTCAVLYVAPCCEIKNGFLIRSPSSQLLLTTSWLADMSEMKYDTSRHSMAFSSSLFPYFRDADGQPLTARDDWGHPPLKAALGQGSNMVQPGASWNLLKSPRHNLYRSEIMDRTSKKKSPRALWISLVGPLVPHSCGPHHFIPFLFCSKFYITSVVQHGAGTSQVASGSTTSAPG